MQKIELKIRTEEIDNRDSLFEILKEQIRNEGFEIESAEEEFITGMTTTEIIISVVISIGSSLAANIIQERIKKLIDNSKRKTQIQFDVEQENQNNSSQTLDNDSL